jgi:hypothetical protein
VDGQKKEQKLPSFSHDAKENEKGNGWGARMGVQAVFGAEKDINKKCVARRKSVRCIAAALR